MTEEQIFEELKSILVESFMLEPDDITREAHLFHDLDFDSIDAIDLAAKVHAQTGKQLNPEQFRDVQTVGDVVSVVAKLFADE
ncbi:acyl carrier protein [Teredinibacter sp. KSP-S5-2]|uniref:acyl carrier protein n=1 Tax=Teredinibacter sp. KSP-S5-2 TaxID=3034506 RepID=UPI0029345AA6|nr:acyl carrier protein [Teredinibacter sp. KSP-S5-2]WNO09240.1 acyl carrier protein [Teredinibacter sp. KSP-S5-2]